MIKAILLIIASVLALFVMIHVIYILGTTALLFPLSMKKYPERYKNNTCIYPIRKRKWRFTLWLIRIKNHEYWLHINFLKWVAIDLIRGRKYFEIYGIWAFTGYYGQGKSIGTLMFAQRIIKQAKRAGIVMHLASNYNIKGQIKRVTCWEDILNLPDNTILIFDEIQSTFSSTKFKDFPIELLWRLTQSRKRKLVILCTTPVWKRMAIQLRESVQFVIECKNVLKLHRLFRYDFYHAHHYDSLAESTALDSSVRKRFVRNRRLFLMATDKVYNMYDTHIQIDRWDIEDKPEKTKSVSRTQSKRLERQFEAEIKRLEHEIKKMAS